MLLRGGVVAALRGPERLDLGQDPRAEFVAGARERDGSNLPKYRQFAAEGCMVITPGDMIDTAAVVSELYARLYGQFGADSGKVGEELSRVYSNLNETYEIKARLFGFTKAEVDTRLLVYDPGGRVIFDTKGTATNQDFSQWTDVRHALEGQYGSRWELDKPHQRVNIYSTLPVFVSGKIVGQQDDHLIARRAGATGGKGLVPHDGSPPSRSFISC